MVTKDILGKDTIKASVVNVNDETARRMALDENLRRGNLTGLEIATYCYRLTKILHTPYDEVAKLLNFSPKQIQLYNRIIKANSDAVKQAFQEGKLAEDAALAIAKLQDHKKQDELLSKVLKEGMTAKQIKAYVRTTTAPQDHEPYPPMPPAIDISGRRIVIQSHSTQEELVTSIEKLLTLAKDGKLNFTLKAAA